MPGKTMDELLLGKEITKRNCGFSTFKKIKKHVDFFFLITILHIGNYLIFNFLVGI